MCGFVLKISTDFTASIHKGRAVRRPAASQGLSGSSYCETRWPAVLFDNRSSQHISVDSGADQADPGVARGTTRGLRVEN
jgi:hypothetical protein